MNKIGVIFDLDDTLYKEIDYLKSAFGYIAHVVSNNRYSPESMFDLMIDSYTTGKDVFSDVVAISNRIISKEDLFKLYRNHYPDIRLSDGFLEVFQFIQDKGILPGIITDGRSITQRNKIKALGIEGFIRNHDVIISEEFGSSKPSVANYAYFSEKYPDIELFIYVGDNPAKDFLAPYSIGWLTIGITDDGRNIHSQSTELNGHMPMRWIEKPMELIDILRGLMHDNQNPD